MIELKYANEDKTLDEGGWVLDYRYLNEIQLKLNNLSDDTLHADRETIEAILLIANGELDVLNCMLEELEDY